MSYCRSDAEIIQNTSVQALNIVKYWYHILTSVYKHIFGHITISPDTVNVQSHGILLKLKAFILTLSDNLNIIMGLPTTIIGLLFYAHYCYLFLTIIWLFILSNIIRNPIPRSINCNYVTTTFLKLAKRTRVKWTNGIIGPGKHEGAELQSRISTRAIITRYNQLVPAVYRTRGFEQAGTIWGLNPICWLLKHYRCCTRVCAI